jgi:hypothetical protein
MNSIIIADYQKKSAAAQQEITKYERLINKYSLLRLVIFALIAFAIYLSVKTIGFSLLVILFILLTLCFIWLVSRQSYFETQKKYFKALKTVSENEISSIAESLNIYDNGSEFINEKHFYSSDLDVFGKASLFQLVNRSATAPGKSLLAKWLSGPDSKNNILKRQEALEELAKKKEWRLDLQARLLFANGAETDQLKNLFTYLSLPIELSGEKWLTVYIKIAPYILISVLILGHFYPVMNLIALAVAVFNSGILISKGSYMIKSSFIADKIGHTLANYALVFKNIEDSQWQSAGCNDLAQQLKAGYTSQKINELTVLINKLGYSSVMFIGFFLNLFFLWSLKQIIAIENWKRNNQDGLENAFNVIAEYEALISLASLHINYPNWCFPEINDGTAYTLTAKNLAHPLIPLKSRIDNDYELNNTFKVDIITGSNMAGKSTFLRTIGINTVLALCGAPVCAESMEVSVMTVVSYADKRFIK